MGLDTFSGLVILRIHHVTLLNCGIIVRACPSGGMADASVSKTDVFVACEFESHLGHQIQTAAPHRSFAVGCFRIWAASILRSRSASARRSDASSTMLCAPVCRLSLATMHAASPLTAVSRTFLLFPAACTISAAATPPASKPTFPSLYVPSFAFETHLPTPEVCHRQNAASTPRRRNDLIGRKKHSGYTQQQARKPCEPHQHGTCRGNAH